MIGASSLAGRGPGLRDWDDTGISIIALAFVAVAGSLRPVKKLMTNHTTLSSSYKLMVSASHPRRGGLFKISPGWILA